MHVRCKETATVAPVFHPRRLFPGAQHVRVGDVGHRSFRKFEPGSWKLDVGS